MATVQGFVQEMRADRMKQKEKRKLLSSLGKHQKGLRYFTHTTKEKRFCFHFLFSLLFGKFKVFLWVLMVNFVPACGDKEMKKKKNTENLSRRCLRP